MRRMLLVTGVTGVMIAAVAGCGGTGESHGAPAPDRTSAAPSATPAPSTTPAPPVPTSGAAPAERAEPDGYVQLVDVIRTSAGDRARVQDLRAVRRQPPNTQPYLEFSVAGPVRTVPLPPAAGYQILDPPGGATLVWTTAARAVATARGNPAGLTEPFAVYRDNSGGIRLLAQVYQP